jgi:sugar lactone lactonase YvrE
MYDPVTDEVTVLARNLSFANGVGIDQEEMYLVVAETFRLALIKYHLASDKQGTIEYILKGHPSPACMLSKMDLFLMELI